MRGVSDYETRIQHKHATDNKQNYNSLLLDGIWFTHLRAETSVEDETKNPGPFAVVYFSFTGSAVSGIRTRHSRPPMKVKVRGHPRKTGVSKGVRGKVDVRRALEVARQFGVGAHEKPDDRDACTADKDTHLIAIPSSIQVRSCSYRSTGPQPPHSVFKR